MAYTGNFNAPIVPRIPITSKTERNIKDFPRNIFDTINFKNNISNKKYMVNDDQFNKKDGSILRFYAQLDDRSESPKDQLKFRNCHILYYVEDGKIKVYEPHQRNTGFKQGVLINKNRIPKKDGGYYDLEDLNIGKTLTLYGKNIKILDCDLYTKNYLQEMGYRLGTPEPEVIDPVFSDRQEMDLHRTFLSKYNQAMHKKTTFFKTHPYQLHFYVIFNNRPLHFDEARYASMYYDITNNTIKIVDEKKLLEYKKRLSLGCYDSCLILKPTKVPKRRTTINPIGNISSPIILNLNATTKYMHIPNLMCSRAGGANNTIGFLRDSNPNIPIPEEEYYTAKDFDLGITINLFGFQVLIYNCDEFTKEFYRNEFNKELIPFSLPDLKDSMYSTLVYKENFGNREDSLQTCKKLPSLNTSDQLLKMYESSDKSVHKGSLSGDLLKYYLNCSIGNNTQTLTFLSRVVTKDVYLKDQYFVIRWYLQDDTIDITGLDLNFTLSESSKSIFLRRRKLPKPHSEFENAGTCYYTPKDLFIGNVIYALKKEFLLLDADEYTLDYMERHCDVFIHSNIKVILEELFPLIRSKALNLKSSFENQDLHKCGCVNYNDFKVIIRDFIDMKHQLIEQRIKTIARHFAYDDFVGLRIEQLASKIQTELKKQNFDDFKKLETLFRIFDMDNAENKGYFKPLQVYKILRSYPLDIGRDLLKSFVFKFPQLNGLISYEEVVKSLNYFDNPIKPLDLIPYALNINWERIERTKNLNKISYVEFLKSLTTEICPNSK